MNIILIAPVCNTPDNPWFSPGRKAKLEQLTKTFRELGWHYKLVNTAPDNSYQLMPFIEKFSIIGARNFIARYLSSICFAFVNILRLKALKADLIWVYNSRFCELVIALQLKIINPRSTFVIQIEDMNGSRIENSSYVKLALDKFIYKISSLIADKILYASNGMLLSDKNSFFQTTKRSIFPPSLDDRFIEITSQNPIRFKDESINIFYAGGYGYDKGVDLLIEAVKNVPSARLKLAGSCPSEIVELCHHPNIEIVGLVSQEKLYRLYSHADVVVNPHRVIRRTSGIFPFKTIEQIASRALPLSSDLPSLNEIEFPRSLIFQDLNQLIYLLGNSRGIYQSHRKQLARLQQKIFSLYSHQNVSHSLAKFLLLKP